MNWKKRKGNGNKQRLPPKSCKILFIAPGWLPITFWRKTNHKWKRPFHASFLSGDNPKSKNQVKKTLAISLLFFGCFLNFPDGQLRVLQEERMVLGFGGTFRLEWHERKWKGNDKEMERHERKGHESNWKDMNGQVSKWIERKGKAMAISKDYPPKAGWF